MNETRSEFQSFVNTVTTPCCVLSVEKTPDGHCGQIRIVCSNQAYKDTMGTAYYDNMPYYELVPKDNKFERYCFRAAIEHEWMHAYVETRALHCWTDQMMIPLASDREDLGYCQFVFTFTPTHEPERMTHLSFDSAELIIRSCIKMKLTDDFEGSVGSVLEDIIDASGAMAGRVMLVDQEHRQVQIFSERIREDIWPERDPEHDVITYDLIETWESLIGESNALLIENEKDLKDIEETNPAWADNMRQYRIHSLALIPLRQRKEVIGYLYVVNYDTEKVVEVKEMLELLSFFLGTEISNHLFFRKLEELSYRDDLTGLKNRNAMMNVVKELDETAPEHMYGVINLDMNGLKTINDREGHVAGDNLIIKVADALRHIFRDEDVYRIGGDEFIVLIRDIPEDVFQRRVEGVLKEFSEDDEYSLAMGYYWSDGSVTTKEAFFRADRSMYKNKNAFYERYPERKK